MKKLTRKHNPNKKYKNYRKYKEFLRLDFLFKCSYCEASEPEKGGVSRMQIDHYNPKTNNENLETTYSNLFYSCPECNRAKWNYWPNLLQRVAGQYILNICDHRVWDHIDKSKYKWFGKTTTGRWNIVKLKLSSPSNTDRRESRKTIYDIVDSLKEQLALSNAALEIAKSKNDQGKIQELNTCIQKQDHQIETLLRKVEGRK